MERAEKIARGEKVEEEEEEQPQDKPEEKTKFEPRKLEQKRNYDVPPADDSDWSNYLNPIFTYLVVLYSHFLFQFARADITW